MDENSVYVTDTSNAQSNFIFIHHSIVNEKKLGKGI